MHGAVLLTLHSGYARQRRGEHRNKSPRISLRERRIADRLLVMDSPGQ